MTLRVRISRVRALVLAAGLLALACTSRHASAAAPQRPEISFTIHRMMDEKAEGPGAERTYFKAGGKRIVFGQPKGCRCSVVDGSLLILLRDAGADGEIHVSRSPFTPEKDLAANALEYRAAGAKSLPGEATNIVVQPPELNPYPFNGWKSLGFTWTYSFFGRSIVRTVSYINLELGMQIVVTTIAVKDDAEKVAKIAKQFMGSWWVMEG